MVNDLFAAPNPATPLAEKLRPQTIDEVIGQKHLLGPGKPLRVAFDSGKPHSICGRFCVLRMHLASFNKINNIY